MNIDEYIIASKTAYQQFVTENHGLLTETESLQLRKMFNEFILDMFSRGLSGGLLEKPMKRSE